jgi:ERCC4-type nuclease
MILVDPRVGSKQFLDPIKSKVNCPVIYAKPQLNSGDFAFEGNGPGSVSWNIGIELKVLDDMLGSMRSERYAGDQLVKMSSDYDICYLIIQGQWRPDKAGRLTKLHYHDWVVVDLAAKAGKGSKCFMYSELDRHICSLELIKNVVVVRSSNENETAWQVVNRYNWWQKAWENHNSTDPIKLQSEVVFGKVSLLRKMASELPGIGWARSKAVEGAFINVHHMVNAPVEAWMAIEGIGETTARKVWKAVRERAI